MGGPPHKPKSGQASGELPSAQWCCPGPAITHRLGEYKSITHEVDERRLGVNVVEGVSSFQALVSRVVHDGGGQRVEAQEVCHLPWGALEARSDTATHQSQDKARPEPYRGSASLSDVWAPCEETWGSPEWRGTILQQLNPPTLEEHFTVQGSNLPSHSHSSLHTLPVEAEAQENTPLSCSCSLTSTTKVSMMFS